MKPDINIYIVIPCYNPKKFGKLANHKQEPWKLPLPNFIEKLYFKRFKKDLPEVVKSIEQIY